MRRDNQSQSSQPGRSMLLAIFLFLLCAFGSAFFAAHHRRSLEEWTAWIKAFYPAPVEQKAELLRSKKQKRLARPLVLTAELADPTVVFPNADFSLADGFVSTDFCAVLQSAFPAIKLEWRSNALFRGFSECDVELGGTNAQDEAHDNSLYIQIRRGVTSSASMVRLKLVYNPADGAEIFIEPFQRAAKLLFAKLVPSQASDLLEKMNRFEPISVVERGITIKFFQEELVKGAFDLMIGGQCAKFHCQSSNPFYRLTLPHDIAETDGPNPDLSAPEDDLQQE